MPVTQQVQVHDGTKNLDAATFINGMDDIHDMNRYSSIHFNVNEKSGSNLSYYIYDYYK